MSIFRRKPLRTLLEDTRHAQDELARQAEETRSRIERDAHTYQDQLHLKLDALRYVVAKIRPSINVALSDSQVAQVAERFSDQLVLPQWAADQIAESARYGQLHQWTQIYAGASQIQAEWNVFPDGTLQLQLTDHVGARFWTGTFHAPRTTPESDPGKGEGK